MVERFDKGRNMRLGRDDEVVRFAEEAPPRDAEGQEVLPSEPWRVLIADDDDEVHISTAFVLRGVCIDSRPLQLYHAHSAVEAETLLRSTRHIAVLMLDVVMETPDAGLRLIEVIRKDIGLNNLRIILRTGQPGYAPEIDVIRDYDINDYRTKADLTQTRLITSLTSAVRAYQQLEQIQAAKRGMDALARASNELFRSRRMEDLARSLFKQLGRVLGIHASGLFCVERLEFGDQNDSGLQVFYGCGEYAGLEGKSARRVLSVEMQRAIQRCLAGKTLIFEPHSALFWLGTSKSDAVVVLMLDQPLSSLEQRLLEMFSASLSVGFENVDLIERLDFFAFFDSLTRLPNRNRFINELNEALFVRQEQKRILVLVDVVRFSEVNEALGVKSGDSLLILIAKRLRSALGAGVKLARVSGDTFGLFGDARDIDPEAVKRIFTPVFFVHGQALPIQVRLGIVEADAKSDGAELLRNAGLALMQTKALGGGTCVRFSPEISENALSRVNILQGLRAAIDFQRGLALNFQPVLDLASDSIEGVEAFVRWRDDRGVLLAPARFIPLAEQAGLIGELAQWVMGTALKQFSVWQQTWAKSAYLSINLSAVQFRDEHMSERMLDMFGRHGVSPSAVVLELNQTVSREDRPLVLAHLQRLRSAGVRIAFDDFGVDGFSLRQLLDLPLEILKVERSFTERVTLSEADRASFKAIMDLSRARGLGLVAKGVETAEQQRALEDIGCQVMQGYFLAQPMTEKSFEDWLRKRPSKDLP